MLGVLKVRRLRLATHKWAVACALLLGSTQGAWADFLSTTLFYTTYNGGQNVNKVTCTYDTVSHVFTQGSGVNVASTPGADGIIFAPNGNLLVGGQGNAVYQVNPGTGSYTTSTAGGIAAFHMALDPSGTKAWASGIPGGVASIPLTPFGTGTSHAVVGSESAITNISFNSAGTAVYTTAGPGGSGNVGFINLSGANAVTTRIHTNVAGAHGMTFDTFTNTFIMFSGNTMVQLANNAALTILGTRVFAGEDFDQGTADGQGHLFVASNGGDLVFMDYSGTGLITDSGNTIHVQHLADFLDDVAPLTGFGSNPLPAPAGMSLAFIGVAGLAGYSWFKRKKTQKAAC